MLRDGKAFYLTLFQSSFDYLISFRDERTELREKSREGAQILSRIHGIW